jgi:peptidoglycan/LPS O-acetylase OafA/YrhL
VALRERLRAAFSTRDNVRALFVRDSASAGRLAPLDGLRALSILWVVCFHAGFYSIWYLPTDAYVHLIVSPLMLPLWRGDFGVDVFFVLSGFLVAKMVIDERTKTGRVRLGLFQLRRFLRTWPALAFALLVDLAIFWDNADVAWADVVYVSNFMTVAHVCMGWTWSLSIEEQFYVLCPWILRALWPLSTTRRVLSLAAVAAGLSVLAAFIVVRRGYYPFDADIVINRPLDRWIPAFDDLYTKPWMRAGPLLAGVGSAILHSDPSFAARWVRARTGATVGFALALLVGVLATHWSVAHRTPRFVEVFYLATFRPAFGIAVAYVMLFSLSEHPLGKLVGRFLSLRFLYPIGQLAYSVYLLNPMATTLVHRSVSLWVLFHRVPPMLVFLPLDIVTTFIAGALLHVFVERPLLRLRPRAA